MNCTDYISGISISELWPEWMNLEQAASDMCHKASLEGVILSNDDMGYAILDALNDAVENGLRDLTPEQLKELQNWYPETAEVFEKKRKVPYVCHEMFRGHRTGRTKEFCTLGDLANEWLERDRGCWTMYDEATPRQLLDNAACITPEKASAFIIDPEEYEYDKNEVALIIDLAEKYGWDTMLYRADFLNDTDYAPINEQYGPDEIDYEDAVIAAWQHELPCAGWEVEVNHDDEE